VSEVIEFPPRPTHRNPSNPDDIESLYCQHITRAAADATEPRYAPFFIVVGVAIFGVVLAAFILL
jgi:hypothetical protein